MRKIFLLGIAGVCVAGCATLFGWDIQAPGILSAGFYEKVNPSADRVALYLPDHVLNYESKDRGGTLADPQVYHVGHAFTSMVLEGFQHAFQEFIFMEVEPTTQMLLRYGIPYLAVIDIKDFGNRVTLKGQAVEVVTLVQVYDADLGLLGTFESRGSSDAQKVFAKKGGPEVNLNAAVENNIVATLHFLQDFLEERKLKAEAGEGA